MKRAGNVSDIEALAMVTLPSSKGCRITSSTLRGNSGSSSRNKTPLCESETSPGRGMMPPPISPASEIVWCGERNGRTLTSPAAASSTPATLWILVVSSASSKVSGGRMPETRLASMVLPEPGGPIIRMLCPPAQAISSARLAVNCPRTSLKSAAPLSAVAPSICEVSTVSGKIPLPLFSKLTTSISDFTGYTFTPLTTAASRALTSGTIRLAIFFARAAMAIGSAPRTPRMPPSSDSSPTITNSGSSFFTRPPYAPRIPMAMGRSKPEPSFLMSAGARLMVICVSGTS